MGTKVGVWLAQGTRTKITCVVTIDWLARTPFKVPLGGSRHIENNARLVYFEVKIGTKFGRPNCKFKLASDHETQGDRCH